MSSRVTFTLEDILRDSDPRLLECVDEYSCQVDEQAIDDREERA